MRDDVQCVHQDLNPFLDTSSCLFLYIYFDLVNVLFDCFCSALGRAASLGVGWDIPENLKCVAEDRN